MRTPPSNTPPDRTQSADPSVTASRKVKTKQVVALEAQITELTAQLEAAKNENASLTRDKQRLEHSLERHNETLASWQAAYKSIQEELLEARNAVTLAKQPAEERDVWQKTPAPATKPSSSSTGGWAAIVFGVASLMFGVVLTILHLRQEESLEAHQKWMFSVQEDVRDIQKEVKGLKKP